MFRPRCWPTSMATTALPTLSSTPWTSKFPARAAALATTDAAAGLADARSWSVAFTVPKATPPATTAPTRPPTRPARRPPRRRDDGTGAGSGLAVAFTDGAEGGDAGGAKVTVGGYSAVGGPRGGDCGAGASYGAPWCVESPKDSFSVVISGLRGYDVG